MGYTIQSLSLQADAYHMLSDIIALAIGFAASVLSTLPSSRRFTFGFANMEVVGALVNATFLLATCLQITLEAAARFAPEEMEEVSDGARVVLLNRRRTNTTKAVCVNASSFLSPSPLLYLAGCCNFRRGGRVTLDCRLCRIGHQHRWPVYLWSWPFTRRRARALTRWAWSRARGSKSLWQ